MAQEPLPDTDGTGGKSVLIPRLAAAPRIDGRADEALWRDAAQVSDFHQYFPQEYGAPSQRTDVRLFYTEDALHVAVRMWEEDVGQITAQVLRQGQGLGSDDIFALILDPYLDRRNGYRFEVNANGVRWDGLFQNVSGMEGNWDGIWQAAAVTDEAGWTAEMTIPFQTLSFNPDSEAWGVNFFRARRRNNESIAWVSRNREVNPSVAGTLTGLRGLRQGLGLDIVPSFTAVERRDYGPAGTSDNRLEPSLDIYYKLTSQLNASLTLNTDFSATEVDGRQVNLTRFNLFFPEKRDFFLREADIFEFGQIGTGGFNGTTGVGTPIVPNGARQNARPFFSRKIGLSNSGMPVDINAGAKISGRVGDWNVGGLLINQDESPAGDVDAGNIFVGRLVRNVLSGSQLGVIATHGDPQSNLDSSLLGADFRYRNASLPGGKIIEGVAFYQRSDTEGKDGDDASYGFGITAPNSQGWQGLYNYKRVERNFDPAVGFVNRTGIQDHAFNFGYRHFRPPGGFVRSMLGAVEGYRVENLDSGDVSSESMGVRVSVNDNFGDTTFGRIVRNREVLLRDFVINRFSDGSRVITIPAGDYEFTELLYAIQLGGQRRVSANVFLTGGEFYDGDHFESRWNLNWSPSRQYNFGLDYTQDEIHLPHGNFTVRQYTFNTQIAFSSTWSWSNLVQYDNISESVGLNSRLHWIPRAGRQAFLVLNWGLEDRDKNNSFHSTNADLSVKFNYTFRF